MTLSTPNGTRGARQPKAGHLMRWMNGAAMKRIRTKGGSFMGMDALVLTTVGAKTGIERSTPVGFFPDGDDRWLIVASAAGAAKNPGWYYNLGAHADRVTVQLAGRSVPVTIEELQGEERAAAWKQIVAASPRFGSYETKTDRVLPIIRLTPRA